MKPRGILLNFFQPAEGLGESLLFHQRWEKERSWQDPGGARCTLFQNGILMATLGMGNTQAGLALTHLYYHPDLQLKGVPVLSAGIAGGDPQTTSLASLVVISEVVDADFLVEVDDREIPPDWPWGLLDFGNQHPDQAPPDYPGFGMPSCNFTTAATPRNQLLSLLEKTSLEINPPARELNRKYACPKIFPVLMEGGILASNRFWHGQRRTEWARSFYQKHSTLKAPFAVTAMEEAGLAQALKRGKPADDGAHENWTALRAVSNFCHAPGKQEGPGQIISPEPEEKRFPGCQPALENLFQAVSLWAKSL